MNNTRLVLALLAIVSWGCEAQLVIDSPVGGGPGGGPPVVILDDAGTDTGVVGDGGMSIDTGMAGGDSSTPPPPMCVLPSQGECVGNTARWCDGATVREEVCTTTCAVIPSLGRVGCEPEPPPPVVGCDDPIEQEVIALANAARADAGLGPLSCDPDMTRAARLHSQDMCDRGYFSHTSLDGPEPLRSHARRGRHLRRRG